MSNLKTQLAATSIALLAATAAFADNNPLPKADEDISKYGEVEGWTAFANKTRKNCYISRVFGTGAVQMGVTADPAIGYLGVFTKEDVGIRNGRESEIFVSIAGKLYGGVATGMKGDIQEDNRRLHFDGRPRFQAGDSEAVRNDRLSRNQGRLRRRSDRNLQGHGTRPQMLQGATGLSR